MRIGIDARLYGITGIGRYVKNLISELEKQDKENDYVVFLQKVNFSDYQPASPRFSKVEINASYYSFAEQIIFPLKIMKSRLDLMHFVNYNVPLLYFGKRVITIHDLIGEEYSTFGMTTRNVYYYQLKRMVASFMLRWSANWAYRVFVPSKSTEEDVIAKLNLKEEKLVITSEGMDEVFLKDRQDSVPADEILNQYGIKKPYLIYVSTMYPYKNHHKLIDAFGLMVKDSKYQDFQLVLVAKKDAFSDSFRKFIQERNLTDKIVMPLGKEDGSYLSDEKLQVLLANAVVYISPSLKEGFALTILEAWSQGLPVIASDIPVFREIGEGAIAFFDPNNVSDIVEKIKNILSSKGLRQRLIANGRKKLESFSWKEMARCTKNVYLSLKLTL